MPAPSKNLGRLVSTHSTAPAFLQRAAIVAVVSFVFFLAMLIAFYIRQQLGYFLLSTGFLVVYVFTLIGWIMQKRSVVSVYERGLKFRKLQAAWEEITSVNANREGLRIAKGGHEQLLIPPTVSGFEGIVRAVKNGVEGGS